MIASTTSMVRPQAKEQLRWFPKVERRENKVLQPGDVPPSDAWGAMPELRTGANNRNVIAGEIPVVSTRANKAPIVVELSPRVPPLRLFASDFS